MRRIYTPEESDDNWFRNAMCREMPPDLFFVNGEDEQSAVAKMVCGACAVKAECLNYALDNNQVDGVWGGTTEVERRQLKKEINAKKRTAM